MTIEEATKEAAVQLGQSIYLSECSNSPGIRAIHSKKSDMLSTLLYAIENQRATMHGAERGTHDNQ